MLALIGLLCHFVHCHHGCLDLFYRPFSVHINRQHLSSCGAFFGYLGQSHQTSQCHTFDCSFHYYKQASLRSLHSNHSINAPHRNHQTNCFEWNFQIHSRFNQHFQWKQCRQSGLYQFVHYSLDHQCRFVVQWRTLCVDPCHHSNLFLPSTNRGGHISGGDCSVCGGDYRFGKTTFF